MSVSSPTELVLQNASAIGTAAGQLRASMPARGERY
jgi:hypothetical protein